MIFVTLGTQKFQFNRLLSQIDSLITEGKIKEDVFVQVGYSTYIPKHYEYKEFLNKREFEAQMDECDLLITHSGVATIMQGLKKHKPTIVVPRLSKYGEHIDDHQLQIAESFAKKNYVLMCKDTTTLDNLVTMAKQHVFEEYVSQRTCMIDTINKYIETIN